MVTQTRQQQQMTGTHGGTSNDVMQSLVSTQANAISSYLNYKRYHWFTFGPHFRDLHLFFDEVAEAALGEVDPFGERLRMLGGDAISHPREMLQQALDNEHRIIDGMRRGAKQAEECGDYGTNDLFSQHVQTHEKYAWFIDEFLKKNDGMGM
jgi:starvation-inducible DNA-binding protein